MGENQGGEHGSLLSALKNIAATLVAGGKTRLELLGNEIEEEKIRALQLVFAALGMAFCFGLGVLLVVALLTALFWESRLIVLGFFAAIFLSLGGFFLMRFKTMARRPEKAFAASIAELQEDLRQLKAMAGHEPPA